MIEVKELVQQENLLSFEDVFSKDLDVAGNCVTGDNNHLDNYLKEAFNKDKTLYLLKDIFGDKVDLRFYKEPKRSFHPKAYIVEYEQGGDVFVGSSNVSR